MSTQGDQSLIPDVVTDLLNGFRRSKVLFAATELDIFDALHTQERNGRDSLSSQELAAAHGWSVDGTDRLLKACVSLGILEVRNGHADGGQARFALNDVSRRYFASEGDSSVAGYVVHSNKLLYPVRTGDHMLGKLFAAGENPFEALYRTDNEKVQFFNGMHSFSVLTAPAVISAFDLAPYARGRAMDVAGGTGALAAALKTAYVLNSSLGLGIHVAAKPTHKGAGLGGLMRVHGGCRHPGMSVTVMELPAAVRHTRGFLARMGMEDAVDVLPLDMFTDPWPGGHDLVVMSRILHDWPDDQVAALLAKAHASLRGGGALLIAEQLLGPDECGPAPVLMQSLNMLVQCKGRERTLAQYTAMLEAAGFGRVRGKVTGLPLDALIAYKS